jgi:hypothetical protein
MSVFLDGAVFRVAMVIAGNIAGLISTGFDSTLVTGGMPVRDARKSSDRRRASAAMSFLEESLQQS